MANFTDQTENINSQFTDATINGLSSIAFWCNNFSWCGTQGWCGTYYTYDSFIDQTENV